MSIIRAVGGEFNTTTELDALGTSVTISTTQKRSGSYSIRLINGAVASYYFQVTHAANAETFTQFALFPSQTPISGQNILAWKKGTTVLGGLRVNADQTVGVYTGDFASLVGSSTTALQINIWNVIQVRVKIDASGIIQLMVNSSTIEVNYSGNTKPGSDTTIDTLRFSTVVTGAGNFTYYDDIIVCDVNDLTGGINPNNSWPGGAKIFLSLPTGAGTYAEWTPDSGSNYARVNELPPVIASYITATVDGKRDTYAMTDSPAGMGPIAAVIPTFWCQKSGSPAINNVKPLFRSGTTDNAGGNIAVPTTFTQVRAIIEYSPFTNLKWTQSEFDGLEFGPQSAT